MKFIKALNETFSGTRDPEMLRRAVAILEAMGNNTDIFTNPIPALDVLQVAKDNYEAKLAISSKSRGLGDISLKNEAKQVLADVIQQLAFYVNTIAKGHLPTLYASGFRITTSSTKGQAPTTPNWLRSRDGHNSGDVLLDFERVGISGVAYEYAYGVTDDLDEKPEWGQPIYTTTSRKNEILGLIPLTVLHIRVRSLSPNGYSDWTPPIKHIVR